LSTASARTASSSGRSSPLAADERALRMSDGDDAELVRDQPLLAFLNPGRFASIGESLSFPFPVDFRI